MLLPSAIACDRMTSNNRPQRPKLHTFEAYSPHTPQSYSTSIIASCRALHSILGGSTQSPAPEPSTPVAPINPFATSRQLQSPPRLAKPSRGLKKRRRDEYEEDEDELSGAQSSSQASDGNRDRFQTPKRQRRVPLEIPAGLHASDFASLTPAPIKHRPQPALRSVPDEDIEMPWETPDEQLQCLPLQPVTNSSPMRTRSSRMSKDICNPECEAPRPEETDDPGSGREMWSPNDDRRLVEAVLSKLNLSKRDWNDCARQLGKDKDSLGRRWKMLVGKGNIGLRRGIGRQTRSDLDIRSW